MVVKESLPKRRACFLNVGETRFLLQDFDELDEVATWLQALDKEVNMIRHEAIRVDRERSCAGFGAQ